MVEKIDLQAEKAEEVNPGIHIESLEKHPELKELLDKVDFDTLRDILKEIADRSGVNTERLNFIDPKRIYHLQSQLKLQAAYSGKRRAIFINNVEIDDAADKFGFSRELGLVHALCHEEVHATSKNECRSISRENKLIEEVTIGYLAHRTTWAEPINIKEKEEIFYSLFNEGVTEKLAQEVFAEYLRRTGGAGSEAAKQILKTYKENPAAASKYWEASALVDFLVEKISEKCALEKQRVWQAFVEGMYKGGALEDEEVKNGFDEIIGSGMLKKISTAKLSDIQVWMELLG